VRKRGFIRQDFVTCLAERVDLPLMAAAGGLLEFNPDKIIGVTDNLAPLSLPVSRQTSAQLLAGLNSSPSDALSRATCALSSSFTSPWGKI